MNDDALGTGIIHAFAPGRVNLIGEHTDYTGGLALPMAIQLGTSITGRRESAGTTVRLTSTTQTQPAVVPTRIDDPRSVEPSWARYVAGVVHELRTYRASDGGFDGVVTTTLPVGSGLSSSASLELAVALALGFDGSALQLAMLGQRAEHLASGVPCGIMDQLTIAAGVAGHALLLDFTTMTVEPVPVPEGAEIVVVHSGQERTLAGSAYADRRASCETATTIVGPLADASLTDLDAISDPTTRARARHVITENERVRAFADAFRAGDLAAAGTLMNESHTSLRDDFDVSTLVLDELVTHLRTRPGVHGARLTGAGFGGCVVALTAPGSIDPSAEPTDTWIVQASAGAQLLSP